VVSPSSNTVASGTARYRFGGNNGGPFTWVSPPIDRDVTIASTVTFNLWGSESSMSANVQIACRVERILGDGSLSATAVVAGTVFGTELGTAIAAQNFTATPTSTAFKRGDRLLITPYFTNIGTQAAGFTVTFGYDGATAGANGDSYVTFTETFDFLTTDPTGTTLYPTTTAGAIDPGGAGVVSLEAWTSRGSGVDDAGVDSAAAPASPLWLTYDPSFVLEAEWYTKPLQAFTLAGPVLANLRASESNVAANATVGAEIAVCNNDGSGAVVWGYTLYGSEITASEAAYQLLVSGGDVAVTDGQRIRLRLYADDASLAAMVSGHFISLYFAGTSGGASGDTYLTFGQTLTEFVAALAAPPALFDFYRRNNLIRR
jgi:hypothetical protein